MGEDIIPRTGRVQVWQDLCIHRGSRLSLGEVRSSRLKCPYHGWEYNTEGQCVHIPAHPEQTPPTKAHVKTYLAGEKYGLIWVSLGNPEKDIPPFPEEPDPAYRKVLAGPFGPVKASAPRIIENFLDVAHFPFVHAGSLGDESRPEIADYTVETGVDGVAANDIQIYQPDPYGTGVGDIVNYQYRVYRPFTAYLAKQTKLTRFSILFPITVYKTSAGFYGAGSYDLPMMRSPASTARSWRKMYRLSSPSVPSCCPWTYKPSCICAAIAPQLLTGVG
jgi:phenylpropionate dioxygenase-like ring-hydroxylating dioxygenase large terminal subunit